MRYYGEDTDTENENTNSNTTLPKSFPWCIVYTDLPSTHLSLLSVPFPGLSCHNGLEDSPGAHTSPCSLIFFLRALLDTSQGMRCPLDPPTAELVEYGAKAAMEKLTDGKIIVMITLYLHISSTS